ncbi:diguanylate cyclase [Clostridium magnum]|uniref:Phytochrome-like protein cph2 n=1 Tax=Clostridium magnum DSM 2767 TaxID=1121326 RepID=A0A162T9F0_9CLOT|nr:diguanylate cyclase [Clostridium magnum]KZL92379.1 phytochrome-like protein cph2 [Clostridium magnum DSM 2767]SHH11454.1 diguanylate cyclase (GGDEF) domain-containing protein [Clostridium magnum DSM 2767]
MNSIFAREDEVLKNAISALEDNIIETDKDKELYRNLVEEYKALLEQTKRITRISDMIGNKLNCVRRSVDKASKIDFLTNIYNRRYFNELLIKEWKSCEESKSFLSILMIDVDKFKRYNDIYGHLSGDKCLKRISEEIKNVVKESNDIVSRYGGEEFIVLIPNSDLEKAKSMAENLRKNIELLGIVHQGSEKYKIVTVSIGIASAIPNENLSPEKLINLADDALYRAKNCGRNRVSL